MKFYKYHALGNDYIVLDPENCRETLTQSCIRLICHRHYGMGADGVLFGPMEPADDHFKLRIFNPDASEAEKSGNGLRIFARHLWETGRTASDTFSIDTLGGKVKAQILENGRRVTVDMGSVSFHSTRIPVAGPPREVINEEINVSGKLLKLCAATIGNPHCVICRDEISEAETRLLGPIIEKNSRFPNGINVQFMKVVDRANIQIEIWERGAGYTLASGSSSCAAAAVARRLGLCDAAIEVHMPGGKLDITVSDDFSVSMTGTVTKVAEGNLSEEMFKQTM